MHPLGRFLLGAVLLVCAVARGGDWTVIKYGGRDHVTMRNVAQFYQLEGLRQVGHVLTMGIPGRSLRGAVGSNELYINNLKFILSYPVEEVNGEPLISGMDLTKVIEPVLRPSRISNAAPIDSVVLDPGHGGHDNGAVSAYGYEKTYALDVAYRTKALLESLGLHVYMTRTTDEFIPLEDRVRFANGHPTALFVAIHFNSGGPEANGVETYSLAPRGVPSMAADGPMLSDLRPCAGNVCDAENMALACATHASLIAHSRMFDRGIKRARFVVIRDIRIPGVLVEGGFLSNPSDARLIATPQYREEEAQCIAIAVRNYRNAVGAPVPVPSGSSVVVRDDVNTDGVRTTAAANDVPPKKDGPLLRPLPPIGEAPPTEYLSDEDASIGGGESLAASKAPAVKKAAPPASVASPEERVATQMQNAGTRHSFVTPIVD